MSLKIVQIFIPHSYQNFNYLCFDEGNKNALIIDPFDLSFLKEKINELNLNIVGVLNTHHHPDHIRHNSEALKLYACPLLELEHKEKFYLSDTSYLVAHFTPGHIDPHFCFEAFSDNKSFALLTGDLLFNAGVGNCKNGGEVETLYQSIKYLLDTFSDDTIIYPGHDYFLNNLNFSKTIEKENKEIDFYLKKNNDGYGPTTLGIEKLINPFLRLENLKNIFKDLNEKEIFIHLREKRDLW